MQIGEFAINENPPFSGSNDNTRIRERYGRYIGVALGLQIPNFYLWNLYNSGSQQGPAGHTWQGGTTYTNAFLYTWLDGKWLVEPNGTWGFAAAFLMEQWAGTLSTGTPQENSMVAMFPNPSSNFIKFNSDYDTLKISICDLNGRVVMETDYLKDNAIDISHLATGVYAVIIQESNRLLEVQKLIKN